MKVRIKKLKSNAVIPVKAHPTDAGMDLYATDVAIDKNGAVVYGTGLAFEIPRGYVGLVFPRSSIAKMDIILSNCVGVVDSGYRGEVTAKYKPVGMLEEYGIDGLARSVENVNHKIYQPGERIGQIIILPYPEVDFEEAEELSQGDRGANGYGSTGR